MSVRSKAKITSKGQITLPAEVRRTLGVARGDEVVFEIGAGQVTVTPNPPENRFRKYAGRYRIGKGRTVAETDAFVRRLRGRDE